jgi:hypothetical protein
MSGDHNMYCSANQLAAQLDDFMSEVATVPMFTAHANMLREQAEKLKKYELRNQEQIKRIAELEKELKRTKFAWNMAENEIERLTPQTNAEPVAWMDKETGQVSRVACYSIPLYTTPQTKPLSDEEIEKLASSKMWDYLTYARAIEERHGIK